MHDSPGEPTGRLTAGMEMEYKFQGAMLTAIPQY
jgi:hypothetical protein